ncbi:MAG: bacillithiol biosynthesis deacetylase BshB1 [Flavobacteriaceae bacterium]|nr:bacillithiol biosynthesis deacetylase BshB1 [Flavobacteriaceae bacterium]
MTTGLDILAFGAHPDDVELGCGGTLLKEISFNKSVGIIDLTRGELGTRGTAEIRDKEAAQAADILGVKLRENLGFRDGFFKNDEAHQMEVIRVIRKYRPRWVLCNAQNDRHIDHGRAAALVHEACFLSGLQKIESHDGGKFQDPWRPKQVYHYMQWNNDAVDFAVDISGFMEQKLKAVQAYASQFYDPNSDEPETPISSKNFLESIRNRAADLGRLVGVNYAEGFTTQRQLGVGSLSDLI